MVTRRWSAQEEAVTRQTLGTTERGTVRGLGTRMWTCNKLPSFHLSSYFWYGFKNLGQRSWNVDWDEIWEQRVLTRQKTKICRQDQFGGIKHICEAAGEGWRTLGATLSPPVQGQPQDCPGLAMQAGKEAIPWQKYGRKGTGEKTPDQQCGWERNSWADFIWGHLSSSFIQSSLLYVMNSLITRTVW